MMKRKYWIIIIPIILLIPLGIFIIFVNPCFFITIKTIAEYNFDDENAALFNKCDYISIDNSPVKSNIDYKDLSLYLKNIDSYKKSIRKKKIIYSDRIHGKYLIISEIDNVLINAWNISLNYFNNEKIQNTYFVNEIAAYNATPADFNIFMDYTSFAKKQGQLTIKKIRLAHKNVKIYYIEKKETKCMLVHYDGFSDVNADLELANSTEKKYYSILFKGFNKEELLHLLETAVIR
jgi:hypothetical protein